MSIVTDRDLAAVMQHNLVLNQQLKKCFDTHEKDNDSIIVNNFVELIAKYLNLPHPN